MPHMCARWMMWAAFAALPLAFAQKYTPESGMALPDSVPQATRDVVAREGIAIKSGGDVVVSFWMRTTPFEGEPMAGFGVRYDNIPEGAFLGVAHFTDKGSDYREQSVPSGIYTLRFGLHPEDGDHMGVAASRDFALLSPVDKDLEVTRNYSFEGLVELTKQVGNPHPTVARLELPEGETGPHLWENDYEHWVLDLEVADTVVGIVIDGHFEE